MDGRGRPREYQVRRGRLSASGQDAVSAWPGETSARLPASRRLHYTVGTRAVCSLQASSTLVSGHTVDRLMYREFRYDSSILGYDSAQQNENKYNWTMVWPTTVHWNCVHDAKHYIQTVYKFSFNGCFLNASHKTKFFRAFSLNSQNSSVLSYQLKWFLQPQMKKLIPYHMLYTILFRFCV